MTDLELEQIADKANLIVDGYAFTIEQSDCGSKFVRVLNLDNPNSSMTLTYAGEVIASTVCDIEEKIILDMYFKAKEYDYLEV